MSDPIRVRIPYTQAFIRRRCRNTETERFWDDGWIIVDTVEPDVAPVAYRVSETDALAERREHGSCYAVRSFRGGLWWPLMGNQGFVGIADLLRLLPAHHDGALLAIDPTIETPLNVSLLSPENYFERNPYRTMGASDRDERWALARRGATQMFFCDGNIYVEAGEPLFYLVHTPTKGMLGVAVGAAALGRRGTPAIGIPGPSSRTRAESARLGTAYAIGEVEDEIRLQLCRGNSVFNSPKIEIVLECHLPDTAALLCARVLAEFLWSEARRDGYWTDSLRRSVPTLAYSRDDNATSDFLPFRETLEQLASCKDQAVRNEFFNEIRSARDVLRRLRFLGHGTLDAEDEAALFDFGRPRDEDVAGFGSG